MWFLAFVPAAPAMSWQPFHDAIQRVEGMVWDSGVRSLASRQGLDVMNVTWEDTGRSKGSVWGPNISDMTIGVRDSGGALHPMPVFRFDNFTDVTADISPDEFWVRVGNERNRALRPVTLTSLLQAPRSYMADPGSWTGRLSSLLAARDSHVLVSAQACFLPIPRDGAATFTPVLYNYQSSPGNPAVLAIVATREGTSMQVVENEGGYLSQPLYFNDAGQRAPFVAERASDFRAHGGDATSPGYAGHEDDGLNVVLVVQVPLKQRAPVAYAPMDDYGPMSEAAGAPAKAESRRSDVENAVVSHGPVEGPFHEFSDLPVERDPRFPVRVTVQFYKATSNGIVTAADIAAVRRQIDRVYAEGDWVGSLVTEGWTGRPTESGPVARPDGGATWADPFWTWHTP